MAAQYCFSCGGPLPPGARFCAYCGRLVALSPSAPSEPRGRSATTFGSAPPAAAGVEAAAGPRRGDRHLVRTLIVILVIVGVAISAIGVYYYETTVEVTRISVFAPDDVCGLNSTPIYYTGFNASTGAAVAVLLPVPNYNTTANGSCTLRGVATNTSGFAVGWAPLPSGIPDDSSGVVSNGTLNLTLSLPGQRYVGAVYLILS